MNIKRTLKQTKENNENTKAFYRKKSLIKMVNEFNEKGIKPNIENINYRLHSNSQINKAYLEIRKQWSEIRLKQRIKNRKKYKKLSNKKNKERYKKDPVFKQKMKERNVRNYENTKNTLKRTTQIERNLLKVIEKLEKQKDNPEVNVILSYLYRIKDDSIEFE